MAPNPSDGEASAVPPAQGDDKDKSAPAGLYTQERTSNAPISTCSVHLLKYHSVPRDTVTKSETSKVFFKSVRK